MFSLSFYRLPPRIRRLNLKPMDTSSTHFIYLNAHGRFFSLLPFSYLLAEFSYLPSLCRIVAGECFFRSIQWTPDFFFPFFRIWRVRAYWSHFLGNWNNRSFSLPLDGGRKRFLSLLLLIFWSHERKQFLIKKVTARSTRFLQLRESEVLSRVSSCASIRSFNWFFSQYQARWRHFDGASFTSGRARL